MTEVFVSAGVIGASGDVSFLQQLPSWHALQRLGDRQGKQIAERRMGAFISEHRIGGAEIHVREEYALGDRRRFYVMTAAERVRDTAEFIEFDGLNFD